MALTHSTQTQVGPYRLLHLLGSGGMGQVFAAVHESVGNQVALKVLSSSAAADPQRVARFLQEARALARLEHPGVVRILHYDRVEGTAYLAMEHLQGQSLRQWMQEQSSIPLSSALAICAQIATTMVDVHAQGIVHRDLKPENIFLCPDPSLAFGHRVKLLDFGIAKVPDGQADLLATQVHTHEATFIGTFRYMAPEQCRSAAKVDGAADVYALGVILFELLAGRPPFDAEEPVLVISAHQHEEPPSLKQLVPAVPTALATLIADMLEKQPSARPDMARCQAMFERAWTRESDLCPVPGLAPFTEAHAELFFGRQEETRALLDRLEEARLGTRRWVQLEGPSGVGKSSLIQAALLPRLKELSSEVEPRWLIAPVRPSDTPLRQLADALVTAYAAVGVVGTCDDIEAVLRRGPVSLHDFVMAHTPRDCRLLLVLEPMEELFTLGSADLMTVDALLSTALAAPETPLRLFTSLRSDFIHRLEQMPSLPHHLHAAARFPLLPMGDEALGEVVQGMASRARLRLSEGLAERMVRDVRSAGGRLPLLGHTLQSMWMLSGGAPLTHEHYERLGGVGGALAIQAEALLESLGVKGKQRAKWLLLELVRVGRGTADTRRPRSRRDVLAAAGNDALAEEVLHRLSGIPPGRSVLEHPGLRLIVLSGDAIPSLQRVELVHETLLHRVPSLATWLEEERVLLERQADLEGVANAWEQAHRPQEGLPTGTLLEHYKKGFDTPGRWDAPTLSPRARDFLLAAERLSRHRVRIKWSLLAGAALAVLAIFFYAVQAARERQHAQENLRHLVQVADGISEDADWHLSRLAHTLDLRLGMLTKLASSLTGLSTDEHAQHPVRLATIRVMHRLGDVAYYAGSLAMAEQWLFKARRMIEAGLIDKDFQWQLALNDSKLGKVAMARGRWELAGEHLLASLRHMEGQPQVGVSAEDTRRSLAVSLAELAELKWEEGRIRDAAVLLDRAIELHSRNPEAYNEALLAVTFAQRAEVAIQEGALQAAEAFLARALQLARRADAAQGGEQFYRWPLGRTLVAEGRLHLVLGRIQEAAASHSEARRLGEELLKGEPSNKRFALMHASALQGGEDVARATGQVDEGEALRQERCTLVKRFLAQDPEDVRFRALSCGDNNP